MNTTSEQDWDPADYYHPELNPAPVPETPNRRLHAFGFGFGLTLFGALVCSEGNPISALFGAPFLYMGVASLYTAITNRFE